jgi:hypothetical protein
MKKLLLVLSGFLPLGLFAQPVINGAENFKVGDSLIFQNCNNQVYAGHEGANITWDFSNLDTAGNGRTIETMVDAATTNYHALFPAATMAEKYDDGTYVYFYKNANNNYLTGYVDSVNGRFIHYPNPVTFAQRPLHYKDSMTDYFSDMFTYGQYDFTGGGTITLVADGWGKLILPSGTFKNVLRVKISQQQSDTLQMVGSVQNTNITMYAWFDNAHSSALLKIDSTVSGASAPEKSVQYLVGERYTAIVKARNVQTLGIYPNPADEVIGFSSPVKGRANITNTLGQTVKTMDVEKGNNTADVSDLPAGLYILNISDRDYYGVGKMLIEK